MDLSWFFRLNLTVYSSSEVPVFYLLKFESLCLYYKMSIVFILLSWDRIESLAQNTNGKIPWTSYLRTRVNNLLVWERVTKQIVYCNYYILLTPPSLLLGTASSDVHCKCVCWLDLKAEFWLLLINKYFYIHGASF